ncbi:hypothetical protein [uncultured Vibrio sp.]|uniref:hypothetical protein n=1 Tax=uncultured Vibrio sp. TaxID=114054 RepID=UPI002605CB70|nr:hypothetical protein [uncultured Vibrio sp.]
MKHFLPSSVMLTPFLVKYYDEESQDTSDSLSSDELQQPQVTCSDDSMEISEKDELEATLTE